MTHGHTIVMTTTGDKDEAERLAAVLVERRLAACVQIVAIDSHYVWEGKAQNAPEFLLLVKTRAELYAEVEQFLTENHSYDTPEIIQVPITAGSAAYLAWIDKNTASDTP
jgi:periplasmic divalent cation tolerance protein